MRTTSMLLLVFAGACAGNPARSYVAPAPEGALACALRTTAGLGYSPVGGGVADGYIKLTRPARYTEGERAQEVGTRVMTLGLKGSNRTVEDQLTITGAGQTLRINSVGVDEQGKPAKASAQADGHVQAIIAGCALPGTQTNAPQP